MLFEWGLLVIDFDIVGWFCEMEWGFGVGFDIELLGWDWGIFRGEGYIGD